MRRKTPGAFIKALKETEDWISDATTRFINDRKSLKSLLNSTMFNYVRIIDRFRKIIRRCCTRGN